MAPGRIVVCAEQATAERYAVLLRARGYDAYSATEATEALTLSEETRPAIVLTWSDVAGADPLELVRGLGRLFPKPRVAVVVREDDVQKCGALLQVGADALLLDEPEAGLLLSSLQRLNGVGPVVDPALARALVAQAESGALTGEPAAGEDQRQSSEREETSRGRVLEFQECDAAEIIRTTIAEAAGSFPLVTVEVHTPPSLPAVAVPEALQGLLHAVVEDACRRGGPGSTVTARAKRGAEGLTVTLTARGSAGEGEDGDLDLPRSLVALHGGILWAEPLPAGGTKISFTLPPHPPALAGEEREAAIRVLEVLEGAPPEPETALEEPEASPPELLEEAPGAEGEEPLLDLTDLSEQPASEEDLAASAEPPTPEPDSADFVEPQLDVPLPELHVPEPGEQFPEPEMDVPEPEVELPEPELVVPEAEVELPEPELEALEPERAPLDPGLDLELDEPVEPQPEPLVHAVDEPPTPEEEPDDAADSEELRDDEADSPGLGLRRRWKHRGRRWRKPASEERSPEEVEPPDLEAEEDVTIPSDVAPAGTAEVETDLPEPRPATPPDEPEPEVLPPAASYEAEPDQPQEEPVHHAPVEAEAVSEEFPPLDEELEMAADDEPILTEAAEAAAVEVEDEETTPRRRWRHRRRKWGRGREEEAAPEVESSELEGAEEEELELEEELESPAQVESPPESQSPAQVEGPPELESREEMASPVEPDEPITPVFQPDPFEQAFHEGEEAAEEPTPSKEEPEPAAASAGPDVATVAIPEPQPVPEANGATAEKAKPVPELPPRPFVPEQRDPAIQMLRSLALEYEDESGQSEILRTPKRAT